MLDDDTQDNDIRFVEENLGNDMRHNEEETLESLFESIEIVLAMNMNPESMHLVQVAVDELFTLSQLAAMIIAIHAYVLLLNALILTMTFKLQQFFQSLTLPLSMFLTSSDIK